MSFDVGNLHLKYSKQTLEEKLLLNLFENNCI